jgi:hypothetical protein
MALASPDFRRAMRKPDQAMPSRNEKAPGPRSCDPKRKMKTLSLTLKIMKTHHLALFSLLLVGCSPSKKEGAVSAPSHDNQGAPQEDRRASQEASEVASNTNTKTKASRIKALRNTAQDHRKNAERLKAQAQATTSQSGRAMLEGLASKTEAKADACDFEAANLEAEGAPTGSTSTSLNSESQWMQNLGSSSSGGWTQCGVPMSQLHPVFGSSSQTFQSGPTNPFESPDSSNARHGQFWNEQMRLDELNQSTQQMIEEGERVLMGR